MKIRKFTAEFKVDDQTIRFRNVAMGPGRHTSGGYELSRGEWAWSVSRLCRIRSTSTLGV